MNPIIKTAIPVFLLTQVGNSAMVVGEYSKGEPITSCVIKACVAAVLSILVSVIIASLIIDLTDGSFLSDRKSESHVLPRKKIDWGHYSPVIVGFRLFTTLMVAATAYQYDSYHDGKSLAMCIAHGALMAVGSGVSSALAGLSIYAVRSEL